MKVCYYYLYTLKIEAVGFCETLLLVYVTVWHQIADKSNPAVRTSHQLWVRPDRAETLSSNN
jgi:hypothetical protein